MSLRFVLHKDFALFLFVIITIATIDLLIRKTCLEHTVVELVYKFDEKSTASVRKGKSTAKVLFKPFCIYKHINI